MSHPDDERLRSISETVLYYSKIHLDYKNDSKSKRNKRTKSNVELSNSLIYLDKDYLKGTEGFVKLLEICLCILCILLGFWIDGVDGERGFALFISLIALLSTITILVSKLLTINRRLTPQHWFVMEATIYLTLALGFIFAVGLIAFVYTNFWLETTNTALPVIEAVFLSMCSIIYIIDSVIVYKHRQMRTWIPFVSDYKI
uniref:MARVEL domain-containing protein n=1 Tax=Ditylenchus dipsaci TaxID=166011 RepID=A0A915DD03_9BILA